MEINEIEILLVTLGNFISISYESITKSMTIGTKIINELWNCTKDLSDHQKFTETVLSEIQKVNDNHAAVERIKKSYLHTHQLMCDYKKDFKTSYETILDKHTNIVQQSIDDSHKIIQTLLTEKIPDELVFEVNMCIVRSEQDLEDVEKLYFKCQELIKQIKEVVI